MGKIRIKNFGPIKVLAIKGVVRAVLPN